MDRSFIGHFQNPKVCVKTPFVMSFVYGQIDEKVLSHLEVLGHELKSQLFLKPQMPFVFSAPPPLVLGYRGLAVSTNSGIQRQQYPAVPRDSRTCLLVLGVGI